MSPRRNGGGRSDKGCIGERSTKDYGRDDFGVGEWVHGSEGASGVFTRVGYED